MEFSRRRFLANSALTTVGAFGASLSPIEWKGSPRQPASYRGRLAIMQGLTNESTAQMIVLTESHLRYGYQVVDESGHGLPVEILRREVRHFSAWGIEKLIVRQLSPGGRYTLKVIHPDSGQVVDERFFSSLETRKSKGRFVVASCMKDSFSSSREVMWDAVNQVNPDLVLLIGDTCYADSSLPSKDEAGYWTRYTETRGLLSHFRQKKLIPTLAVWDDHDFGGNNYDGTFKLKNLTRDLFEIFWGNEIRDGLEKGPGVSQAFTLFGQRFLMMDSRFERSPSTGVSNPRLWGRAQENFLLEQLGKSAEPALIFNGSQFFGGYLKKDAFEYVAETNLREMCREISKLEAPVAFVSGDVHFSEVMALEPEILGYKTVEFTSSSIHSLTFPFMHLQGRNSRRVAATSGHNFMLIEAEDRGAAGWSLQVRSVAEGLETKFESQHLIRR